MIPIQTAGLHEPAEGALHHPAPREQVEALGVVAAFDNFQGQAAVPEVLAHLPHPGFQFALITAVGKDQTKDQK